MATVEGDQAEASAAAEGRKAEVVKKRTADLQEQIDGPKHVNRDKRLTACQRSYLSSRWPPTQEVT